MPVTSSGAREFALRQEFHQARQDLLAVVCR